MVFVYKVYLWSCRVVGSLFLGLCSILVYWGFFIWGGEVVVVGFLGLGRVLLGFGDF